MEKKAEKEEKRGRMKGRKTRSRQEVGTRRKGRQGIPEILFMTDRWR